ncbi:uncharacterized protein LOC109845024 isoform X2 [Asparagus officinalis]|uniref:uncharacterized protein LOC109845024 isoform X2 n=1 Tax=Asparagus officinalis TaxID=4686 RepID=UPI00098E7921|nr:uncharacterized protein LOC109845024 isoform X2 [Asparagus officinalis]
MAYAQLHWITEISDDALFMKNFIMNHSMRLSMFNDYSKMKLLSIADTRFASWIIMFKRFKVVKRGLQDMVLSDRWSLYREDDVGKAQFVKEKVLDDLWWDKIDFILDFTGPIYKMIRVTDTDTPCLHLVYDMWDTMIEKVKQTIYRHESKRDNEESPFYEVVHKILVDRWNNSNTPLQCLAHSLVPRSPGMCCYREEGGCDIRLSAHLLKFCSNTDLKNILLHEMIHAYLYVTSKKKDRSYHGPRFTTMMNGINSSTETDPWRPLGGYNITSSHDIRKEADCNRVQRWICKSCGDSFEGSKNSEPNDCIENVSHGDSCGNSSCQWHKHKMVCSGRYEKTTDKSGNQGRRKVSKDAQESQGDESKGSSRPKRQVRRKSKDAGQMKDASNIKKLTTIDDSPTSSGIKSPRKKRKAVTLKTEGNPLSLKIPKRPRRPSFKEKIDYPVKENFRKRMKNITIEDQYFAFYGDEESDKDIEPLINKRTERRKTEKLSEIKAEAVDVVCFIQNGENSKQDTALAGSTKHNVVCILDDD